RVPAPRAASARRRDGQGLATRPHGDSGGRSSPGVDAGGRGRRSADGARHRAGSHALMFYHLVYRLHDTVPWFRVFRYITFRSAYATITALLIAFIFGPTIVRRLRHLKVHQRIRQDGPVTHRSKAGTPTMGGIIILLAIFVPSLLWGNLTNRYMQLAMVTTLVLGLAGLLDDYLLVVRGMRKGLLGRYKLALQFGVGLLVGWTLFL